MKNANKNEKKAAEEAKKATEATKEVANTPSAPDKEITLEPEIKESVADLSKDGVNDLGSTDAAAEGGTGGSILEAAKNAAEEEKEAAGKAAEEEKEAAGKAAEEEKEAAGKTAEEEKEAAEKAAGAAEIPAEKEKPWVETNPEYRPEAEALGLDEDGTPKISANLSLNRVGKKVIALFAEREGSNLPKITGTELTAMCKNSGVETVFQPSDAKGLVGRVILKADGTYLSLPLDINEEFNFGIDFDAMAERARQEGKEWGEAELAKAKEEAELDEKDKNRLSLEKLNRIAEDITNIFTERSKSNLPGVTEGEILKACRNHVKSIGIEFKYSNADNTSGVVILKEFLNEVRVPETGEFTFGIDYEAAARAITEANK